MSNNALWAWISTAVMLTAGTAGTADVCAAEVGVGAAPPTGADILVDGTRATLDNKWTYWQGPRFKSSLPIKWKIVDDPVDQGELIPAVHSLGLLARLEIWKRLADRRFEGLDLLLVLLRRVFDLGVRILGLGPRRSNRRLGAWRRAQPPRRQ